MEQSNHTIENQIEEAKYQLRVEIAEKCLMEDAPINFIMKICSLTKKEVTVITRSMKRKEYLISKEKRDKKQREMELKKKEQKFKKQDTQTNNFKQIERGHTTYNKEKRQREADIQREIAAENTRLLLQKLKNDEINKQQKIKDKEEAEILREQELKKRIKRIKKESKVSKTSKEITKITKVKKEFLEDENTLSRKQKMIASVGNCYLRGLDIKQAVIFSRASKEDVERIYNSFKNK
ncbi:hypothetical protein Fleli_2852 [Bernardetia litoralis DSM 6794]|uniref:Uncharacterized protein n=1 Tax=Bernardetia litoralis (strain ATCC 23117 / DSM 6794 / NBRC 15988 / NCIMB 1366 / Fx l1 / Sio-4) TaxID=880071 RepID=I4AMM0_BERLS|nr:hypothetical protein [Bernardetia litoralis]AFM05205.1 hypothetical protein Fleli_2852 [Bernardetia litoralis DSM 6794]